MLFVALASTVSIVISLWAYSRQSMVQAASAQEGKPTAIQHFHGIVESRFRVVHARVTPRPPHITRAQHRALAKALAESEAGMRGPVFRGRFPKPTGPGVTLPTGRGAGRMASDPAVRYRTTTVPVFQNGSAVNEPTSDASGRQVFATGNWYAARSSNNGLTWAYVNPLTLFGSGFCCDQQTAYEQGRDRFFWVLQYSDGHLVVANSLASDLTSWCWETYSPSQFGSFGIPRTDKFDFNQLAFSTRYVYITTNVVKGSSYVGALIIRKSIDTSAACRRGGAQALFQRTSRAVALVQGAGDAMFWGTNWTTDLQVGTTFRITRAADNTNAVDVFDRTIDPFSFMTFGGNQNCASPDGVVTNWCQRTDSRMTGTGYLAVPSSAESNSGGPTDRDAVVGFAFNAKQDPSHPYPYIRRVYFRAADVAYLGRTELWCSNCALLYPTMAPDLRGHIAMAFALGGGSSDVFPGAGVDVDDDVFPTQPWGFDPYLFGSGNACVNQDGRLRWGDYLSIHAWSPSRVSWIATGYALRANAGSCGASAPVTVRNVVFGEPRDLPSYTRWSP